jgi:hypothetical protein
LGTLPMDLAEPKEVRTQETRGDFGVYWEPMPARSHWTGTDSLAEARICLYLTGHEDREFSCEIDPDEARAVAAMLTAWADACEEERKVIVPRPW